MHHRILAVAAAVLLAGGANAAPSGGSSHSTSRPPQTATPQPDQKVDLYEQGLGLVRDERYEEARKLFTALVDKNGKDADALNMLAFTQRKTGDLDAALENYHRALELRPKFPEAREYLGEAYLQLALRELETLRKYGDDGRDEHKQLVSAFHAVAAQLDGAATGAGSKW
jgi:tetratricopeptide (TPR) repeat protein